MNIDDKLPKTTSSSGEFPEDFTGGTLRNLFPTADSIEQTSAGTISQPPKPIEEVPLSDKSSEYFVQRAKTEKKKGEMFDVVKWALPLFLAGIWFLWNRSLHNQELIVSDLRVPAAHLEDRVSALEGIVQEIKKDLNKLLKR